jgi:hypothetical protein
MILMILGESSRVAPQVRSAGLLHYSFDGDSEITSSGGAFSRMSRRTITASRLSPGTLPDEILSLERVEVLREMLLGSLIKRAAFLGKLLVS